MGRNLETQHSGVMTGGVKVDCGKYSFCSGSWTVDLPIYMTAIWSFMASPLDATDAYVKSITTDADISNGFITLNRQTSNIDVSVDFYYEVKGC